ncbi:hypothetical protein SUGI_0551420 [Cryptomeria japonica]|uniref:uncharacterized protein LOC131064082 n=1 Tax=Cryptomeria japonica TaxID=3369 RepID=UPI002408EB29|nr:uncharacterized protein LOC131064082 [Cryptomeria japonica]GLJ28085.1 hypothetical protein SUGI_0551420 [Cryptomeria japonica]
MEMGESSRERMEVGQSSRGRRPRRKSKSARAGVIFPVTRVRRYLKEGRYAKRVRWPAAVFLTAAIEYIVEEVLEASGRAAQALNKTKIIPRHILLAVRGCKYDKDEEDKGRDEKNQLLKLFSWVIIPQGGVVPYVNPILKREKATTSSPKSPKK